MIYLVCFLYLIIPLSLSILCNYSPQIFKLLGHALPVILTSQYSKALHQFTWYWQSLCFCLHVSSYSVLNDTCWYSYCILKFFLTLHSWSNIITIDQGMYTHGFHSKVFCLVLAVFLLYCLRIWSINIIRNNGLTLSPCLKPLVIANSTDLSLFKLSLLLCYKCSLFSSLKLEMFQSSVRVCRIGVLLPYQMQTVDPERKIRLHYFG